MIWTVNLARLAAITLFLDSLQELKGNLDDLEKSILCHRQALEHPIQIDLGPSITLVMHSLQDLSRRVT